MIPATRIERPEMALKREPWLLLSKYERIRKRGGSAALDYVDGVLVLMCSQPDPDDFETWGWSDVPMPYPLAVRVRYCEGGEE